MKHTSAIHLAGRFVEKSNDYLCAALEKEGLADIVPAYGDLFNELFRAPEGLSVTQLAERTNRTKSTVSVLSDKLVARGYLQKTRSSVDARASVLLLTEKGAALEPVFARISIGLHERATRCLTDAEVRQLERLLEKARQGFREDESA